MEFTDLQLELLDATFPHGSHGKARWQAVLLYMVGMKLAQKCTRCNGTGRYSYNNVDGSRCYGCGGVGVKIKGGVLTQEVAAKYIERIATIDTSVLPNGCINHLSICEDDYPHLRLIHRRFPDRILRIRHTPYIHPQYSDNNMTDRFRLYAEDGRELPPLIHNIQRIAALRSLLKSGEMQIIDYRAEPPTKEC